MTGVIEKPSPVGVAQRMDVFVMQDNDHVILRVGNTDLRMHYADALKISTWMRIRGKQAKRFAGDTKRHWSVIGILEDAEEAYRRLG